MARDLQRIVVVGAGLSGLAAARSLVDRGHQVVVFDKGRAPGGRASTRRESAHRSFDHGAQFFTARGAWLTSRLDAWEKEGVVRPWAPRIEAEEGPAVTSANRDSARKREAWWVGTPGMGSVAAHLARGLDVRTASTVTSLRRAHDEWRITGATAAAERGEPVQGFEHVYDALIVSVPAPQCVALLGEAIASSELGRHAADARLEPCWAVMVALETDGEAAADLLTSEAAPLAWAAREASKPGRSVIEGEDLWTLHASPSWSRAHLEADPPEVASVLAAALVERLAVIDRREGRRRPRAQVLRAAAHRWRYARASSSPHLGCLHDEALDLAICGDWLESARVEGALTSGVAAATRLLDAADSRS